MKRRVYAVILASGKGERLGYSIPKQFLEIGGRSIVERSIDAFENNRNVDHIIIVINPEYRNLMEKILAENRFEKIISLLDGGKSRRESSAIGISLVAEKNAKLLIHDAVRPFVSDIIINSSIEALESWDAVNVAVPVTDTIIVANSDGCIEDVPDRSSLMKAQTPQGFNAETIKKAHELAEKEALSTATDDAGLIIRYNLSKVFIVEGEEKNIKITYPEDIKKAEALL